MSRRNGDASYKRKSTTLPEASPAQKRTKLLLNDDSPDSDSSRAGGLPVSEGANPSAENGFTVNEDFARRFEHNKKREELHRRLVFLISDSLPMLAC